MSLIEVIVAAFILMIVLGIVSTMFINVSRLTGRAISTRTALTSGQNVMNEIRRVVRVATDNPVSTSLTQPAVISGSASTLSVTAFIDVDTTSAPSATTPFPAPTKVDLSVAGNGDLVEKRTPGSWNGTYWTFSGASSTRTLPGPIDISDPSRAPLFAYADAAGRAVTPSTDPLRNSGNSAITSITVTVTASNAGDPVVLTDTLGLTNLLAEVN